MLELKAELTQEHIVEAIKHYVSKELGADTKSVRLNIKNSHSGVYPGDSTPASCTATVTIGANPPKGPLTRSTQYPDSMPAIGFIK